MPDPLAPAKGLIRGLALALIVWAIIGAVILLCI